MTKGLTLIISSNYRSDTWTFKSIFLCNIEHHKLPQPWTQPFTYATDRIPIWNIYRLSIDFQYLNYRKDIIVILNMVPFEFIFCVIWAEYRAIEMGHSHCWEQRHSIKVKEQQMTQIFSLVFRSNLYKRKCRMLNKTIRDFFSWNIYFKVFT